MSVPTKGLRPLIQRDMRAYSFLQMAPGNVELQNKLHSKSKIYNKVLF